MLKYETETQEFKKSLAELDKGLESLTAMLNKHCKGDVYYGVSDEGKILGLGYQIGKETLKKISVRISELIKPAINPVIAFEQYEDKTIIHVSASGNLRPYSCGGNYRIRIASENRQIDPDLLGDIFYSSKRSSLENIEALNQKLTFNQLKGQYVAKGFTIQNENFEENMHLRVNGKYNMLAELLSDNNNASIKVVRFAGIDKTKMISRNEYGYKCLILAMKEASNYVNSLNETRVDIDSGLERKEIKLFDSHAFEEAWTNACVHNKWINNVPPAIYIYDDRLEIVSTGGLPFDYSKEEFYRGISKPVNECLVKIMGQLGLIEQTGHGNLLIIAKYGKKAFDIQSNSITVTIPFAFFPSMASISKITLTNAQSLIFEAIKNNPTFTRNQLSEITGLGTTRIGEIINELKDLKMIERSGGKKGGSWKILN